MLQSYARICGNVVFIMINNFINKNLYYFQQDESDVTSIESVLASEKHNATVRVMDGFGPSSKLDMRGLGGYVVQIWLMMWADFYTNGTGAKYIMFFDTDVIFSLPITRSTLFDNDDKPYLAGWNINAQKQFHQPCIDLIGALCKHALSYMSYFPFIYPVAVRSNLF